jgi:hypothetical protein
MTTSSAHLLIIRFFDSVEKNVFQKNNCERIVEILQKLLYNTRPLGPLLPRQYYSTRTASSSLQNLWLGSKGYPNGLLL